MLITVNDAASVTGRPPHNCSVGKHEFGFELTMRIERVKTLSVWSGQVKWPANWQKQATNNLHTADCRPNIIL